MKQLQRAAAWAREPSTRTAPPIRLVFGLALGLVVTGCEDSVGPNRRSGTPPPRVDSGTLLVSVRHHFTGETPAGVVVTISRSGGTSRSASTGFDGLARFTTVEVGEWTLTFRPPPGFLVWPGRPVPQTIVIEAHQTTQHLFEYVAAPETQPRGDVRVSALEPDTSNVFAYPVDGAVIEAVQSGEVRARVTEGPGITVFENLVAGEYVFRVVPPTGYVVASGAPAEVRFTVQAVVENFGPNFQLERTDGTGDVLGFASTSVNGVFGPVPGVDVRVFSAGTEVAHRVTDTGGFYRVGDLAPGSYTIRLTAPSGWRVRDGEASERPLTIVANRITPASFFDTFVQTGG